MFYVSHLHHPQAAAEVAALQRFYETFNTDAARAVYGLQHVQAADEAAAIDVLLLTNELFRVEDVAQRKVYVGLAESVQAKGGVVHIFSTLHPSGEQLKGLTGVAAVLRFPMDLSHVDQQLADSSSDSSSSSGSSSETDESSSGDEEKEMFNVLKGK